MYNRTSKTNKGGTHMTSEFDELDNCLYIQITEEIDHHSTEIIRRKMDKIATALQIAPKQLEAFSPRWDEL